jgi:hypothetical protein
MAEGSGIKQVVKISREKGVPEFAEGHCQQWVIVSS